MKSYIQVCEEVAVAVLKQNKRSLASEKDMYSYWRDKKAFCIEHAKMCKRRGDAKFQLYYQNQAAKYHNWAKESKARIRELGKSIYN